MAFPEYVSYKDSGVEWLGEIPENWEIVRAKYVLKEVDERSENGNEELLSVSHLTGVTPRSEKNVNMFLAEDYSGSKLCQENDLVINTMWAWMGALGVSSSKGIVSSAYGVYRPNEKVSPRFLDRLLRTSTYIAEYIRRSTGIQSSRLRLYPEQFLDISLILPTLEEQNRIVDFLDRTTTSIDQAIAKKQRLIELLNEQKAILINRAVTKGLNPNVPMRDSGIEWIGEIPKHWGVCSLSYIANLTAGGTPDRSRPQYWNGDIPWIKTGEVNYNTIISAEEHISAIGLRNSSAKIAPPDTILMAMYGQGVTRGRVAILGIEAAFNQACLAISPSSKLQVKYLYYYLQSAYSFTRDTGNETSQMNLSSGSIGKIKIVMPSNEEQTLISKFLDQKIIELDEVLSKQLEMIKGLNLLKESFISETVTGKIKV